MQILPVAAIAAALPFAAQAHPAARITKAQAERIALKAAPGKVLEADYEKENGAWRYSFDIRQGNRVHEIGVDANSGKIVESSYETAGEKD
nr:PepSY domain-containing protein [Stakelama sediminis]